MGSRPSRGTRAPRRTVLAGAGAAVAALLWATSGALAVVQVSPAPSGDVRADCPPPLPVPSPGPVTASPSPAPATPVELGASPAPRGFAPDATLPPGVLQWPASIVEGALALVSTDGELRKAAADWAGGIEAQDMGQLLSGVQGLAALADAAIPYARQLEIWPTLTEQARTLEAAYCGISAAAHAFTDAMLAGDAAGLQAANPALVAAMEAYGGLREALMDMGDLAILMQRKLSQ